MTPSQLRKVKQIFAKHRVRFAYLFGSRAEGRAMPYSDYDFAVYFGHGTDDTRFDIKLILMGTLEGLLGTRADVVVLDDTRSVSLRHEVVVKGQTIYEKDRKTRIDFELHTRREYADFLPFLNAYSERYLSLAAV